MPVDVLPKPTPGTNSVEKGATAGILRPMEDRERDTFLTEWAATRANILLLILLL
jgi:hypothetical protein